MINVPRARDVMVSSVITIQQNLSIYKAIDVLITNEISGAPVVDNSGNLVGIISEKDCLKLVSKGINNALPKEGEPVSVFMTKNVETIPPDMDMFFIAGIFLRSNYRRLPVVENGKLIGQVSRVNLLKGIRNYIIEKYNIDR